MKLLTKEQILKADDRKAETVSVPEWGGDVLVGVMTGAERDAFEASIASGDEPNLVNMRARLVAAVVVDEKGNRLFSPADVETLGTKSSAALDRIVPVAQRINRLTVRAVEDAKGN